MEKSLDGSTSSWLYRKTELQYRRFDIVSFPKIFLVRSGRFQTKVGGLMYRIDYMQSILYLTTYSFGDDLETLYLTLINLKYISV